jgi:hypothetical protein
MTRPTRLLIALAVWLALAQCAREVVIDLPEEEPKIVAICHFTDQQHFRLNLAFSQSVNDGTAAQMPQNVDATLSINGGFYDKLYRETSDKGELFWRSHNQKLARAGTEYALVVRVPGYPTAQASSRIPAHVSLDKIVLNPATITTKPLADGLSELRVPLELRLSELPAEGRFFAFSLFHETDVYESLAPPILDYTREDATNFLADGRTISLLHNIPEPVVLVNENFWDENRRTLYLTARIPFDPETDRPRRIFVEWRTLSEEFYRYHLSLSRQSGNLPLSDPDAVFNNVDGGYGNFSGYSVSMDTVQIPTF